MASCTCANPESVTNAIKTFDTHSTENYNDFHATFYGAGMTVDPHSNAASLGGGAGSGAGVPHAGIAPIRFASWAAPEISDTGESAWSTAWRAAAIGIQLVNGEMQSKIADKQMDLANKYYDMAKDKRDRFRDKYVPLEKQLLDETTTAPVWELNCADDRARAQSAVSGAFGLMSDYLSRQARKLRVCVDSSMLGMLDHRQALMAVDTENYNLIDDQFFVDYKNDQRWNRRSNVLNLGRNLTAEALKYGDVARSMLSAVSGQLDKAAGALMGAVGYYGARNDTYMPSMFLSNYGGMGNNLVSTGTTAGQYQPGAIGAGV